MATNYVLTHKEYLTIAIPFIVSTITNPLLGAVDTMVVGQLGKAELIGGVAIGTVILNTIYWLFGFFRVSTTGLSAIAFGKGSESEKASTLIRPAMLALVVGVSFILLQPLIWYGANWVIAPEPAVAAEAELYFDILIWGAPLVLLNYTMIGWLMGQSMARETLYIQVLGNLLNIVLDFVFVLMLDMGVEGVAFATLLAICVQFIVAGYVINRTTDFSLSKYAGMAQMNRRQLGKILSSNTDLMLRTVCLLTMFNSMARFGSSFGADVLAANAIMLQITFVLSYLFDGIANASSVFAGRSVGKGALPLLELTLRRNNQWTTFFVVLLTFLAVTTHSNLVYIFTDLPTVVAEYQLVSFWVIVFPLVSGYGLSLYGIFTGTNTTRPVRNATFYTLLVFLATIALGIDEFQNQSLWAAFTLFYIGRWGFLYPHLDDVKKKCITA